MSGMFGARPESVYLKPPPTKRISLPSSQRLNTILEGNQQGNRPTDPAELSPRIQNARRSYLGSPPLLNDEKAPPAYSHFSVDSSSLGGFSGGIGAHRSQSSGQDGSDMNGPAGPLGIFNRRLTSRGGWKKLLLLAAVVLLVIIGLAVGLGVGLTRRHSNGGGGTPADTPAGNTAPDDQSRAFPFGAWNFDVVLASIDTGCSANANAWTCVPYQTYRDSPTGSRYTFSWNITHAAGNENQLQISSAANLFSVTFSPTDLTLVGRGTPDERYTFALTVPKQVQPSAPLTSAGEQSICYFNQTMLAGTLYTRGANATGSSSAAKTWPGTAYIDQFSPGGMGTPDCYSKQGNGAGARITQGLEAQPASTRCSCIYESNNQTSASLAV